MEFFWRWVFLLVFFLLLSTIFSDPRDTNPALFCGNTPLPNGTNFVPVFTELMRGLAEIIDTSHFGSNNYSSASTPRMFALAQCHRDLSQTDCLQCYAISRTRIPRCLPFLSARIFLDGCFLRYDNYSFYREPVSSAFDNVTCSGGSVNATVSGEDHNRRASLFSRNVDYAVGNVTSIALSNRGFGTVGVDGVYALAQCWESVPAQGCRQCLQKAATAVRDCAPEEEGRGMNSGCYLRYSTTKFFNDGGNTGSDQGSSRTAIIIASVTATFAFLVLCISAAYITYARISKRKRELRNLGQFSERFNRSGLKFKYEILEKATNYFNLSRKIGQGGAGSVYMGILPDGRTVAVKRLVYNTRQWVDEFFNEVNLISRIQHKNLVNLLGCSIEGPESLLVYEYVVNKSLDQFIFDKEKAKLLKWKQRFDIIVGTAEGLAHLHGGGDQMRIIHRDIKSSNVLLDENFNPKIADFGLVRCLAADKSHLSTGIAGTLGYMAPEYLVRGQLTEKADVYSFGVLVIEIVCGKRNITFTQDSSSLIQTVWTLHRSNALAEAIEPSIRDEVSAIEEATIVLQIGLLCAQASVPSRPSMAQVVQMLTDQDCEIPTPNQPPFLNVNLIEQASSSSCSTDSFKSNALRKIQSTGTSSESSRTRSSDGTPRTQ